MKLLVSQEHWFSGIAGKLIFIILVIASVFISEHSLAENRIVAVSWSNLNEGNWLEHEAAIKTAVEQSGDTYISTDAAASVAKQREDIKSLIDQNADVILIETYDSEAIKPEIEIAIKAGIPLISYERPINDDRVLFLSFNNIELGRMQARAVFEMLPSGNYAFMRGSYGDRNSDLIFQGQMEVLKDAIDDGEIKNIGEVQTDAWQPDNARKNMEQILAGHSNHVDAVFTGSEAAASGVIAALEANGLAGEVSVSGPSGSLEALRRVARGTQNVAVWKDPKQLGNLAALVASDLAEGTATSDIENVTKLDLGRQNASLNAVLLNPVAITQDNINEVVEAGWFTKEVICEGISVTAAGFCRSKESNLPVVDVCFGSDRKPIADAKLTKFSHERATETSLGFARISIPEDNHEFGKRERPQKKRFLNIVTYGVEEEDPNRHFVIQNSEIVERDVFIKRSKEVLSRSKFYQNHILLFIHGFNVSFDEALYSAAQISWDINFDGLPCIYSWPSMGKLSLKAYTYDSNSARQSRNRIADFLKTLGGIDEVESISVIAHSMGNVALLEALRQLNEPDTNSDKPYSEIILAAPDMDRDDFISVANTLPKFADGVTLYASSNDKALMASKELAADIPRAGDVPEDGPLVLPFLDSIDASAVSSYVFGLNHSYFAYDRSVVADIGSLILKRERPPNIRDTTLKIMTRSGGGRYWQYPN